MEREDMDLWNERWDMPIRVEGGTMDPLRGTVCFMPTWEPDWADAEAVYRWVHSFGRIVGVGA